MSSMSLYDLISKADKAISSAQLLYEAGDMDGACNRAYYAIFDAAKAVLFATVPTIDPVIGKTHSGLISAFGLHMVKTGLIPAEFGRAFNRAHHIRKIADYRGDPIEKKEADWIIQHAFDFVVLIRENFVLDLDSICSPYDTAPSLFTLLSFIDTEKNRLDAARPLPPHTAISLREKLNLEWTYHSNAIEGNTLTLRETKVVLEGITVGGKSLREHLEVTNHRDAIDYVESIVAEQEPLSEWQIKSIHSLVLNGINVEEAGRYRQENVIIGGASTTPTDYLHLSEEMSSLMSWVASPFVQGMHPIKRAAELHTRFVRIHPFIDGNGRTGRLLMNFELMKAGYPPTVLRKEDRVDYYDALDEACVTNDYEKITRLIAAAVRRGLQVMLDLIEAPSLESDSPSPF